RQGRGGSTLSWEVEFLRVPFGNAVLCCIGATVEDTTVIEKPHPAELGAGCGGAARKSVTGVLTEGGVDVHFAERNWPPHLVLEPSGLGPGCGLGVVLVQRRSPETRLQSVATHQVEPALPFVRQLPVALLVDGGTHRHQI